VTEERRSTCVVCLVRDPGGRVLVTRDSDSAELPHTEIEGFDEDELPEVRKAIDELLGLQTVVVRAARRTLDEERRVSEIALELEPLGSVVPQPHTTWLDADEIARTELSPDDRTLLERLFADEGHPLRPAWAHHGWYSRAAVWLDTALEGVGRARSGPVEQVSNWCLSSILRAPTSGGDVYLKATARSPLFGDEGLVTRNLAERFPGQVPLPLAIDSAERLMLMDDFGPLVGWKADIETRVDVVSRYAELQAESASMVDDLLALGAFDHSPAWLADATTGLLRDRNDLLGLEPAERERLEACLPAFVEACERLAAGRVPIALVHGDLHLANVARNGDGYVFFDWTDACVAHPLMDLLVVVFEEDEALRHMLRDAYLASWVETASPDESLELWRIAEPLASLNQAISYRSIIDNLEPGTGEELEPMLPWWLRKALAAVAQG
jgi:Phosphotransferase enzyme family